MKGCRQFGMRHPPGDFNIGMRTTKFPPISYKTTISTKLSEQAAGKKPDSKQASNRVSDFHINEFISYENALLRSGSRLLILAFATLLFFAFVPAGETLHPCRQFFFLPIVKQRDDRLVKLHPHFVNELQRLGVRF